MIPKTIHYCWFGHHPKPAIVQKCIESWKKYCPDYEIIEWNESNFDIHSSSFSEGAYREKKWAFVVDYVRALVLLQHGGVYLDADMELLRPLDPMLQNDFFAGFETNDTVATGIIGCSKGNDILQKYCAYYKDRPYRSGENRLTSPIVLTDILTAQGLELCGKKQFVANGTVYPKAVFYPTDLSWVFGSYHTKAVGVHHYLDSWGNNPDLKARTRASKFRLSIIFQARNLLGTRTIYELGQKIRRIRRDS